MSIIDKMKKAHPAYWVLGLGGAALAIDYYVEKDRSVASSLYRKFFGAGGGDDEDGGGGSPMLRRRAPMPVMPGSLFQVPQVYYPAYPPVHPHHRWMRRGPIFDRGLGHGFGHGFEHDRPVHHYGAFGRTHIR